MPDFIEFPKIARLRREAVITEKIDGTNAQVFVAEDGELRAGSRNQWLSPGKGTDNHGFAAWVADNREELLKLGPGRHFGEWWGSGIQRGYGLKEKRFSLFNVSRWSGEDRPSCCHTVPVLDRGVFSTGAVDGIIETLRETGSVASPGFMRPEGIIVFHIAGNVGFKVTLDRDEEWKGKQQR